MTETEIQLVRIAEALERNGKTLEETLEVIEQMLVNEEGRTSTLVRIESLLDNLITVDEDIAESNGTIAYRSYNWWQRFRMQWAHARSEVERTKAEAAQP